MAIFDYTEVVNNADKTPACAGLYIDEENFIQLLIARCFTSSVKISHLPRGLEFQVTDNFISTFYQATSTDPVEEVIECVSTQLTPANISTFYSVPVNKARNRKFFEILLVELSQFCMHYYNNNHTAAFVYIYRILEKISYPFPLLYASQTDDYKGSYALLKDYFDENKGSKKGELGFFKAFVTKIFDGEPISLTSVDFDFSTIADYDIRKRLFLKLKQLCPNSMLHQSTSDYDLFAVKFTEMSSFLITVRNRFFHQFNRGDANFEEEEVHDCEEFFAIINKNSIGWLGMVYLEILKNSYKSI